MVLTLAAREGLLNSLFNKQALATNLLVDGGLASFFLSAHEGTIGQFALQDSSETTYTGYDRASIARTYSATTWAKYGNQVRNAQIEAFGGPNTDGTTHTITYIGLGTVAHPGSGFLWDFMQLVTPRVVIPGMTLSFELEELIFTLR
jgi:hypothetical protein